MVTQSMFDLAMHNYLGIRAIMYKLDISNYHPNLAHFAADWIETYALRARRARFQ